MNFWSGVWPYFVTSQYGLKVTDGFKCFKWEFFLRISSKCWGSPRYYSFPTLFLLEINDLPDDVIFNNAIYADDTTL